MKPKIFYSSFFLSFFEVIIRMFIMSPGRWFLGSKTIQLSFFHSSHVLGYWITYRATIIKSRLLRYDVQCSLEMYHHLKTINAGCIHISPCLSVSMKVKWNWETWKNDFFLRHCKSDKLKWFFSVYRLKKCLCICF